MYGSIPGTAVLTSIPLLAILDKLPSYFFDQQDTEKQSILDKVAWHSVPQRNPSYRQFCQDISERFLSMPAELRLRDTTAQSIRLAVTLLRPWFHKTAHHDFALAVSKLSELAFATSQWPGQWWARDHAELWDIISHTALVLGEEVLQQQRMQMSQEVQRLQDLVSHLEEKIERMEILQAQRHASENLRPELLSDTASVAETLTLTAVPDTPETDIAKELPVIEELPDRLEKPFEVQEIDPWPTDIPEILPSPVILEGKTVSILETMVTGFLFGAFVTLCLPSTQRRTLANHLT